MRRSEIIGSRISRKGEGLANDCFLLERGSLPSSTLICTTYRLRIIEAGAEQFIICNGK